MGYERRMDTERWTAVDRYVTDLLAREDEALTETQRSAAAEGLPPISVSAAQAMFLQLLVRSLRARRVLELGTLAGYSAIWMARGLEDGGTLVTCELDPHHAEVARRNFERAGVAAVVEQRVGPASASLDALAAEGAGPFDLVFIDADKGGYPEYLRKVMGMVRPGSVIVADNVVRDGDVADATCEDPAVVGVRAYLEAVAAEPRLAATVVQTVGVKGYDGFCLALVTA
jgi:predicted O-methyltransferase YrrM